MIVQPTQVYFPPEKDINNDGTIQESSDKIAVKKIFDFIIDTTNKFRIKFSSDNNRPCEKFDQCIREEW
jgi:hypothetical protein